MEQLNKIQKYLELVFDKVEIRYDEAAMIRIIVEQNGQKKQLDFIKAIHEKAFKKFNDKDCRMFAKNISGDFIDYLIDNGRIENGS